MSVKELNLMMYCKINNCKKKIVFNFSLRLIFISHKSCFKQRGDMGNYKIIPYLVKILYLDSL